MKHTNLERIFRDPVCDMEISRKSAVAESEYKGKTYYFCAGSCKQTFDAAPEKFIRRHRQHGIGRP